MSSILFGYRKINAYEGKQDWDLRVKLSNVNKCTPEGILRGCFLCISVSQDGLAFRHEFVVVFA